MMRVTMRAGPWLITISSIVHFMQQVSSLEFIGQNLALGKPAWQYPGAHESNFADNAVDGNTSPSYNDGSCSHTAEQSEQSKEPAYWTVDLGDLYYIAAVKIYNRDSVRQRLRKFRLYGYPGNVTLYDDDSQTVKQYENDVIYIKLDSPHLYRNITVYLPTNGVEQTILTLCEVQIFKEQNLALGKPAWQYPGAHDSNFAKNAVDGNTSPSYNDGSCSHTSEQSKEPAYWTVDLGDLYYITAIKIYNRDTEQHRLRQFKLLGDPGNTTLYDDDTQENHHYNNSTITVMVDTKNAYRNITVYLPTVEGKKTILTLCEVEIYGGCLVSAIPNGNIISETGLTKVAPPYIQMDVQCFSGYKLERGSTNFTCKIDGNNYTWDNTVPECTEIMCTLLTLENGNYAYNYSNGSISYGEVATAKCNKGFSLDGNEQRTCQENETWSGEDPICKIVMCEHPGKLDDGYYMHNNNEFYVNQSIVFNSTIEVYCEEGFALNINQSSHRTCQENETWSGEDPSCKIVMCEHPGEISNGHYMQNNSELYVNGSMIYNSTISAVCKQGFKLYSNQSRQRTCSEYGTWTETMPRCDILHCDFLHNTTSLSFRIFSNTYSTYPNYGSIVQWTCNMDSDTAPENLTCSEDGHWNGTQPTCRTPPERQAGLPIGLIAGVSGCLAAVVLVMLIAFIFVRKRRASKNNEHDISISYVRGIPESIKSEFPDSGGGTNSDSKVNINFTTTQKLPENAIEVENLTRVVFTGKLVTGGFDEQFQSLPKGLTKPSYAASKAENKSRNRYKNMYPYDENMVILEASAARDNKYINASYVNGFDKPRAYIATQGPMENTLNDFWEMIWQTDCGKIVMLTNLKEQEKTKCEQYWPDSGSREFGDVTVRMVDEEIFSEFVVRSLAMLKGKPEERLVTLFQFTTWPDKDVPRYASSLVHFRNKVKHTVSSAQGPTVVHCSAGVGRTGTYIALDYLTDQAKALGYVTVVDCVRALRAQRVNLVQTRDQYIFVHHALVEALMLSTSALPAAKFPDAYRELLQTNPVTKKQNLTLKFEMLRKMSPVQDEYQYDNAKDNANRKKNRYSNILPVAEYMPTLSGTGQQETDYINAVFLPSYKERKAFIVTQLPLETTIPDFWRLVYEHDVHTIVMLNHVSEVQKTDIYWPGDDQTLEYGLNKIKHLGSEYLGSHRAVRLELSSPYKTRIIKQFQCGNWVPESTVPDDPSTILLLIQLVQAWQQQSGNHPILVHCMNGAERSGLYCVISAVLERMKIEQDVAISQVIEEMRNRREQIISSEVQFKFCHEAVKTFLEQHDTYSNFTA